MVFLLFFFTFMFSFYYYFLYNMLTEGIWILKIPIMCKRYCGVNVNCGQSLVTVGKVSVLNNTMQWNEGAHFIINYFIGSLAKI